MTTSKGWAPALIVVATSALAWELVKRADPRAAQSPVEPPAAEGSPIFTPAHRSALEAIQDFFNRRVPPVQPVAYTHKLHLAKGMRCVDCHTGVDTGPDAAIPGVKVCMSCHRGIATDSPDIKKIAAYWAREEEIPWQRVYSYSPSAHVKFDHASHFRADVGCESCHGDMNQQTVAVRAIDLTMGYCLDCHQQRKASTECLACHF